MSYDRTPSNPHNLNSLLSPGGGTGSAAAAAASDVDRAAAEREGSYTRTPTYPAGEGVFTQNPAAYQSSAAPQPSAQQEYRSGEYDRYEDTRYDYARHEAQRYEGGASAANGGQYPYSRTAYAREPEPVQYSDYHEGYSRHPEYAYGRGEVEHPSHRAQQRQPVYEYEYDYERSANPHDARGVVYDRHGQAYQQQQQHHSHHGGAQDDYYSRPYDYDDRASAYARGSAVDPSGYAGHHVSGTAVDSPHHQPSTAYYRENQHQQYSHHDRHKYASYGYDARDDPRHSYTYGTTGADGYSSYGQVTQQTPDAAQVDSGGSHSVRYQRYQSPAHASGYAAPPVGGDFDYRSPSQPQHAQVFQRGSAGAYEADSYAAGHPSAYDDRADQRARRSAGIGITSLLADDSESAPQSRLPRDDEVPPGRYDAQYQTHYDAYDRSQQRYERDGYYYDYQDQDSDARRYGRYSSYAIDNNGHAEPHGVMSISQLVGSGGERAADTEHRGHENGYGYGGVAAGYEQGAPLHAGMDAGAHRDAAGYDYRPDVSPNPVQSSRHHGSWRDRPVSRNAIPGTATDEGENGHRPARNPDPIVIDDDTDSGDNMPLAARSSHQHDQPHSPRISPAAAAADDATASDDQPAAKRRKQAQPRNGNGRARRRPAKASGNDAEEEATSAAKPRGSRRTRGSKKVELSREYVYDEDDNDDDDDDIFSRAAQPGRSRYSSGNYDDHDGTVPTAHHTDEYSVDDHVQAYIHQVKQRTEQAVSKYEERTKRKSQRMHDHVVQRYGPYLRGYFERRGMEGPEGADYDDRRRHEIEYDGVNGPDMYLDDIEHGYSRRHHGSHNGYSNDYVSGNGYYEYDDADGRYGMPSYQSHAPPMGYFSPTRQSSPGVYENGYARDRSDFSPASDSLAQNIGDDGFKPDRSKREPSGRVSLLSRLAVEQVPEAYRHMQDSIQVRNDNLKKLAQSGQREMRRISMPLSYRAISVSAQLPIEISRPPKEIQMRTRRSMREVLFFWKRHEKEERELRKRAEKEAAERLKLEEEAREARRQARKLNFLITQTELYSHFIGSKISGDADAASGPAVSEVTDKPAQDFNQIDFDAEDDAALAAHARQHAQNALAQQQAQTRMFDDTHRQQRNERSGDTNVAEAFDEMDFQDPETMAGSTDVPQPRMLMCQLKEYQLKGLTWLANLYEQGINGILADEMGLGKTVQSISLLAYLAETHNIWGPFMVVAPASTLHNWQQELARFVPEFKVLPYWGTLKDRKVLRKSLWNSRNLSLKDSDFHVVVTSYQMIVSDESYFNRVKWQYMHELGEKIEHIVPCELTQRQKAMYRGLTSKISVPELLERLQSRSGHGSKDESDENLMNLVMQFRKVCSHPELFERAEVESPFVSGVFPTTGSLAREGDDISCSFATRSLVTYHMPKMLYRESLEVPNVRTMRQSLLHNKLSLWSPHNIAKDDSVDGMFGLLRLCSPSAGYAMRAFTGSLSERLDEISEHGERTSGLKQYNMMCRQAGEPLPSSLRSTEPGSVLHALSNVFTPENLSVSPVMGSLATATADDFEHSMMRLISPAYKPSAVSPPADLVISDRSATWENESMMVANPLVKRLTCGRRQTPEADWSQPFLSQGLTDIWVPSLDKLISYSGKMAVLDRLLTKLKQEGHRVLLYFQMTKMIDLFEEYLAYRKYTYLRLDGSSKISDRRDMVMDWQTRDDIFIFLLSTRAGGLGINLTAADTVIFFESDWNPTVDSQAMDRAHRLGQTKQVVVYRLITRGTVEERILQRARQKDEIHRIVIAGGDANAAREAQSIVTDGDEAAPTISEGFSSNFEPSSKELVSLLLGETADDESKSRNERLVMARHAQQTSNIIYGAGGYPGMPDIASFGDDWESIVVLPPPNISTAHVRVLSGPLDSVIDGAIEQQIRQRHALERERQQQQQQQRQRGRGSRGGARGGAGSGRGGKRGGAATVREKRKAKVIDASKDTDTAETAGNSKAGSHIGTPEPSSKRPRASASAKDLLATATNTAAQTPSEATPNEEAVPTTAESATQSVVIK
ncbi:putative DNA helicase ino80 [Coemansia interrupta]|uniref:Chromatin-remodeling ATPase INO80 n=1 Tax=Coemansia interrupta TaxID=1126814 RepID=A0A9W8LFF5_9FUNG|nr:putative DNA helicase ino80 [Coemansia interrupta]